MTNYKSETMLPYEIDAIRNAFKRCYGLRDLVQKYFEGSIEALSQQAGVNIKFIKAHLEEIKTI